MLVHPNPMEKADKPGYWEDSKLGKVSVIPYMLNYGNHRKRWGVYYKRGKTPVITSRHITEEQAVVSAQTLANRLYRQLTKRKAKQKSAKVVGEIYVTPDAKAQMMQTMAKLIAMANHPDPSPQRVLARKAIGVVESAFEHFNPAAKE